MIQKFTSLNNGIYDDLEFVNQEKNKLIIQYKANLHDYFIKNVKINNIYIYI